MPVDVQLRLFLKLLHYDRNLKARSEKEIVIGVVYQPRFRASVDTKDEFLHFAEELQEKTLAGIPFRCTPIRLDAEKICRAPSGTTTSISCILRPYALYPLRRSLK